MARIQNITDETFGRLTAKEYMYTEKGKSSTWMCVCVCGKEVPVELSSLRNGNTQSCGCLRIERSRKKNTSHNMSDTSEYHAWDNMKRRCNNKNNPEYKNYGGRGIRVCDGWSESFENFIEDMGRKPSKRYSLDRIDNNKGYFKENCRWTDANTQAINQRDRKNKTTGIRNISYSTRDDLYYVGIIRKGERYRKSFKILEDAVNWKNATLEKIHDKS